MAGDQPKTHVIRTWTPTHYPTGEYLVQASDGSVWHVYGCGGCPQAGTGQETAQLQSDGTIRRNR
jgi:hypothetical protein